MPRDTCRVRAADEHFRNQCEHITAAENTHSRASGGFPLWRLQERFPCRSSFIVFLQSLHAEQSLLLYSGVLFPTVFPKHSLYTFYRRWVSFVSVRANNSSHGKTETNGKFNTLAIHTLPYDEGKGNVGKPMNGTIFLSKNRQSVTHN